MAHPGHEPAAPRGSRAGGRLRIVAGRWGGQRLRTPRSAAFRPTQGKVREALFARLTGRLEGAVVLDLFAGSGSLGLEALSRGARRAIFVERAPAALGVLEANVERLGAGREAQIIAADVFALLRGRGGPLPPIDLLLADPPYGSDAARLGQALAGGGRIEWGPRALRAIECGRQDPLWSPEPGWRRWPDRTYGETRIVIEEREEQPDEER